MTAGRKHPSNREAFKRRVTRWAEKIGIQPERVYLQGMRNKWASCSTAGRLYFSEDLLARPGRFQDRVIVHELLHLIVPNHGALFKSLYLAHLPPNKGIVPHPRLGIPCISNRGPARKIRSLS